MPTTDGTRRQELQAYANRLRALANEGRRVRALTAEDASRFGLVRIWQADCAQVIGELSSGNKQHWLARAFSEAFLVAHAGTSSPTAGATDVGIETIIDRLLTVLDRAAESLRFAHTQSAEALDGAAEVRRFEFVTDSELRGRLEAAYREAEASAAAGDSARALVTACSMLEALITGALENLDEEARRAAWAPQGPVTGWSFADRVRVAEQAKLISAGCARLPAIARDYRALVGEEGELTALATVSAREALIARQVLRVIMRDLAPGR